MKYFTKKMWLGLQDLKREKHWDSVWDESWNLYLKQLSKLKSKIGKRNFDFFSKEDLHGDHILNIVIQNCGIPSRPKDSKIYIIPDRTTSKRITIELFCPLGRSFYLNYFLVKRIYVDSPTNEPLPFDTSANMGTWGYHELTSTPRGMLCHEILLHSGAIIKIEFKKFSYKKIKSKISTGKRIPKPFTG